MANEESDALDALEKEAKEYDKVSTKPSSMVMECITDTSAGRGD